jgi:hypothetical protein
MSKRFTFSVREKNVFIGLIGKVLNLSFFFQKIFIGKNPQFLHKIALCSANLLHICTTDLFWRESTTKEAKIRQAEQSI